MISKLLLIASAFPKKIILDFDPGIDDAFALQFLLNEPDVEILAITLYVILFDF